MKNVLLLHGGSNNSQGNWFPWLGAELSKRGYKVWCPDLPNPDYPNWKVWLKFIKEGNWEFSRESIIVGHSAGATEILRILEDLPLEIKVNKAILVAGYVTRGNTPSAFQYKDFMVQDPFNWEKIKRSAQHFYFIASDNDGYSAGADQAELMKRHLGGEVIFKKGEGHFNLEQGDYYRKFPLLLKLIIGAAAG